MKHLDWRHLAVCVALGGLIHAVDAAGDAAVGAAVPAPEVASPAVPPAAKARVQTQGQGPYFQVNLPWAWLVRSARDDQGDALVLNAAGQALPWAWVPPQPDAPQPQVHHLPMFRTEMPWPPGLPAQGASAQGVAPTWLIDVRKLKGRIHRLHVPLPSASRGVYPVVVEASDDLQHWRAVQTSATLVALVRDDQTLRQEDIDLPEVSTSYLRLRLPAGTASPDLSGADVHTWQQAVSAVSLTWSPPIQPRQCDPQGCDYEVPPHLPLERLKVALAEPQALWWLTVLADTPDQAMQANRRERRHGLGGVRAHLHERLEHRPLRHHRRDLDDEETPATPGWHLLTQGRVHWLMLDSGPWKEDEVALPAGRQSRLRLQAQAGTRLGWGGAPPSIQVATRERSLVFLAQGAAPWQMAWAQPEGPVTQGARAWSELMPEAAVQPQAATLVLAPAALGASQPASSSLRPTSQEAAKEARPWPRAWLLWGVLGLGVLAMAWMVRAVLRGPRPSEL